KLRVPAEPPPRLLIRLPGRSQRAFSPLSARTITLGVMSGERLLLGDHEDNLRFMLEAALRHSGYEVHAVASGREAIDAAKVVEPDLVVLDVMLPDLDVFGVCRRWRQENRRTPVVFLTARDGTDDKVRGLSTAGDDALGNPSQ